MNRGPLCCTHSSKVIPHFIESFQLLLLEAVLAALRGGRGGGRARRTIGFGESSGGIASSLLFFFIIRRIIYFSSCRFSARLRADFVPFWCRTSCPFLIFFKVIYRYYAESRESQSCHTSCLFEFLNRASNLPFCEPDFFCKFLIDYHTAATLD